MPMDTCQEPSPIILATSQDARRSRSSLEFLGGGFSNITNKRSSLDFSMNDFSMNDDPTLRQGNSLTCFSNSANKRLRMEPEPHRAVVDMNDQSPFTLESIDDFEDSFDNSIQTQKKIEAWDMKMGLKRSHSSTMRNTTITRKRSDN